LLLLLLESRPQTLDDDSVFSQKRRYVVWDLFSLSFAEPVIVKEKLTDMIDPTVDLSADSDSALPDGYGLAQDDAQRPSKLAKILPIIRTINKHGEVVLQPSQILAHKSTLVKDKHPLTTEEYRAKLQEHIDLPDLEADKNPDTLPLKIQDVHRYFDAHSSSTKSDQQQNFSTELLVDTFDNELSTWSLNLRKAVLQPKLASQITMELHTLTQVKSTSTGGDIAKELGVTNEFQQELLASFDMGNELLRHFWSTIPHTFPAPPLSQKQTEKLKRVTKAISNLYDELENKKNILPDDKKSKWGSLFLPITQSLNKAVEKYNRFCEKKN